MKKIINKCTVLFLLIFYSCNGVKVEATKDFGTHKNDSITNVYRAEYYDGRVPFWESPIIPFHGESPLLFEEIKGRMYIQVNYDSQNRVVEIKVKQGEEYKEFQGFNGALYIHAPYTKVRYENNKEIHEFYDRFENRISAWGNVYQKVYELDELDRYTSLYFLNESGERIENSWGIYIYEWLHQTDGSIIENRLAKNGEIKELRGMFQFKKIRMIFGPDGHLSMMQNIDTSGKIVPISTGAAQYKYYYDRIGRFLRWEIYDEYGQPAIGPTNTSGEKYIFPDVYTKKISFFGKDRTPTKHMWGAENGTFTFDKYKNYIRLDLFDANKNLIAGSSNFASRVFNYDDSGLYLIEENFLDTKNNLVNTSYGVASVQYKRDNKNLLIERINFNKEGAIVEENDTGIAIITYEYEKNGKLIKRTRLNSKREPINN